MGPSTHTHPGEALCKGPPAAPAPTHRPSDRRPQLRLRAPQLERGRRGWVPTLLGSVCSGELRGAHSLQALFWESQGGVDFAGHPGPFGGQWGWRDTGQAGQGQKGGDEWLGLQGPTPAACGRPGRGGWPGPSDPHCRGVGATAPLERPRPQPAYSVSPSWGLLEDPPTRPRPCPWAETMASRPWGPGGPLSWSGDWLAGTGTLPGEPPVYALSLWVLAPGSPGLPAWGSHHKLKRLRGQETTRSETTLTSTESPPDPSTSCSEEGVEGRG